MFHCNQKLCITCEHEHLKKVIQLILNMKFDDRKHPNLAYQIAGDKFVVGYYYDEPKAGWNKFMFEKVSMDLLLATIKQFVEEHPSKEPKSGDGSYYPGYLIDRPTYADNLKEPYYAIFSVQAYNCYFSK